MGVEVEFAAAPKLVVGVKGKAAPVASVPQEKIPFVSAFTSQLAALRAETVRLVEDAVPETVSAVVEAYGKVEAARVEVATNVGAVTIPVKTPAPVTESGVPGVDVPMPTLPRLSILILSTRLSDPVEVKNASIPGTLLVALFSILEICATDLTTPADPGDRKRRLT